jgi:hypothetical protein
MSGMAFDRRKTNRRQRMRLRSARGLGREWGAHEHTFTYRVHAQFE